MKNITPEPQAKPMSKRKAQYLEDRVTYADDLKHLETSNTPRHIREPEHRIKVYDQRIVDEILERFADGESLRAICRSEPDRYPSATSVRRWIEKDIDGCAARYTRARDLGLDARNEIIEEVVFDRDGDVARDRLILDYMRWNLAKMAPKRFRDRVDITSAGEALKIVLSKDDQDLL